MLECVTIKLSKSWLEELMSWWHILLLHGRQIKFLYKNWNNEAYLAKLLLEILVSTWHVLEVEVSVESAHFIAARRLVIVLVTKDGVRVALLVTIGALYLVMGRAFENGLHLLVLPEWHILGVAVREHDFIVIRRIRLFHIEIGLLKATV